MKVFFYVIERLRDFLLCDLDLRSNRQLYSLFLGDLRMLEDTDIRMEHLNYIKYNWNINSKFDKATMNYLLIFCVLKEVLLIYLHVYYIRVKICKTTNATLL